MCGAILTTGHIRSTRRSHTFPVHIQSHSIASRSDDASPFDVKAGGTTHRSDASPVDGKASGSTHRSAPEPGREKIRGRDSLASVSVSPEDADVRQRGHRSLTFSILRGLQLLFLMRNTRDYQGPVLSVRRESDNGRTLSQNLLDINKTKKTTTDSRHCSGSRIIRGIG